MPIRGSCHCGHTQFEVSEAPPGVTRCTCSLCAKRGALWAYYTPAQFRLTSPPEDVATYRWGSRTVKHQFCADIVAKVENRTMPKISRKQIFRHLHCCKAP